jgi:hypothetical protein
MMLTTAEVRRPPDRPPPKKKPHAPERTAAFEDATRHPKDTAARGDVQRVRDALIEREIDAVITSVQQLRAAGNRDGARDAFAQARALIAMRSTSQVKAMELLRGLR